jgi:signal transduction histidine kinase
LLQHVDPNLQPDHPSGAPLLRLLFVDNAQIDYTLLVRFIELGGYRVHSARVESAVQMREALTGVTWDAVISELDLPGFALVEVLSVLRESGLDTPLIVVTGDGGEDAAVEALVAGAADCVSKSRLARLAPALRGTIAAASARRQERAELARLRLLQSHLDHVDAVAGVARDLHDVFSELMTELAGDLRWLAGNTADDTARARVHTMQQAFGRARERAQRGIRALRPPLLELGIVHALQTLAQSMLRPRGIAFEFAANRTAITLDEAIFFALYRVCQESLLLFTRQQHSQSIHIELFAQAASVTLEVADEGMAADADDFSQTAFGELREAVAALGGSLEISRPPRHGTSVILSLPLAAGA